MTIDAARRRTIWQIALLSAGFLVLVAISVTSIYFVNLARTDANWVVHTIEIENQISLAQLQMRRAESATRGYLLTEQNEFGSDFDEADKQLSPTLEKLKDLTIDNPVQIAVLSDFIPLTNQRFADFRRAVDLARAAKFEEARKVLEDGSGRSKMNRIRDLATEMRAEEQRLFAMRTRAADQSQSLAAVVTTTGSGLVIALAGISIFLVRRSARARDDAEQQLRDNNLNLEATIDERTADLRDANEEIQRFAYIVSHDLRSPLVNIMGFTSELDELRTDIFSRIARYSRAASAAAKIPEPIGESNPADAPELHPEDKQLSQDFSEALGFIKSSIGKMDRLISAILNLTREGRREFKPVKIDTRELIETIISSVAHQASESNTQIRIEPLPNIVSDRLAMEQVFSNLIDNALKYLKPGVAGDIVVKGRHKQGFAVFEVIDNGRGIDPKDHTRIFDLFRRAGLQDQQGQGIGLAHVRALVRRMGGAISVSSELHTGSTFTVTLPAQWNLGTRGREI
ncbi:MAG: CHASE3 domain-containing protein [Pseudomonadota bacterium]